MNDIQGKQVDFGDYREKVCLVVNTASRWGLTSQYAGLRTLYTEYGDRGFVVLAFPCNQFANQEPGTNSEIYKFVTEKYQVDFPVFEKIEVNGANRAQLYEWLTTSKQTEDGAQDISWNFTKFLVNRSGNVESRFEPKIQPKELGAVIEELL